MSKRKYSIVYLLTDMVEFHKEHANRYLQMFNESRKTGLMGMSEYYQEACEWHKSEQVKREMEIAELLK
jgi:hypothetical protein